jgi:hypothetical protein
MDQFDILAGLPGPESAQRKAFTSTAQHNTTQHRKTKTNIHAFSGIRTYGSGIQPGLRQRGNCVVIKISYSFQWFLVHVLDL